MNTGDSIQYVFVTTTGSIPVTRQDTTIYFDANDRKISVGNVTFDGGTLPAATSADSGKVLQVDSNGSWVATSISPSLPDANSRTW